MQKQLLTRCYHGLASTRRNFGSQRQYPLPAICSYFPLEPETDGNNLNLRVFLQTQTDLFLCRIYAYSRNYSGTSGTSMKRRWKLGRFSQLIRRWFVFRKIGPRSQDSHRMELSLTCCSVADTGIPPTLVLYREEPYWYSLQPSRPLQLDGMSWDLTLGYCN